MFSCSLMSMFNLSDKYRAARPVMQLVWLDNVSTMCISVTSMHYMHTCTHTHTHTHTTYTTHTLTHTYTHSHTLTLTQLHTHHTLTLTHSHTHTHITHTHTHTCFILFHLFIIYCSKNKDSTIYSLKRSEDFLPAALYVYIVIMEVCAGTLKSGLCHGQQKCST